MDKIYKKVALELGISEKDVKDIYKSYWRFIRDKIEGLPLKEDLSLDEFNKLRTNFNIPSLGKLSCTYQRYLGVKKREQYKRKRYEDKESKATS